MAVHNPTAVKLGCAAIASDEQEVTTERNLQSNHAGHAGGSCTPVRTPKKKKMNVKSEDA